MIQVLGKENEEQEDSYKQLCKPKEPRIAVSTVITN